MKSPPNRSAFIIAAPSSGSGKTTVTLGLMAALKKRGLNVQPFKAGPDYIDPGHHRVVCEKPSYNLDTWMMGEEPVRNTFKRTMAPSEVGIVEGVMGLFDGKGGQEGEGSTAHLAKVLNLPVLLVIDASRMASSAAAILYGFENYDPDLQLAGVILNKVGSANHYEMIKEAMDKRCKTPLLGYLPREATLTMRERHLGLVIAEEEFPLELEKLIPLVEQHIDLDKLLALSTRERFQEQETAPSPANKGPVIAVARDHLFCFYYEENLDILKAMGAQIRFFSPLKDKSLPQGTSGIYLGGGYPELEAEKLAANHSLKEQIKIFAQKGGPLYAECGGLMYLGEALIDKEGKRHPMAGIFPWTSRMLEKRKRLGYQEVTAKEGCPFLPSAETIRGHEFHYSQIESAKETKTTYEVVGSKGGVREEGYLYQNTLASYVHVHFASNPLFARRFLDMAAQKTKPNK